MTVLKTALSQYLINTFAPTLAPASSPSLTLDMLVTSNRMVWAFDILYFSALVGDIESGDHPFCDLVARAKDPAAMAHGLLHELAKLRSLREDVTDPTELARLLIEEDRALIDAQMIS
jgi:hypothetical protein